MPGIEKIQRALVYWAKAHVPEYRDTRYSVQQLENEAREAIEGRVDPPLGVHGSWNHAAVKMACAGVINNDWSQAREFFEEIDRRGMNEYGPLYWILTVWCCEWCALMGPPDVSLAAREFLGFMYDINTASLVDYPARLELYTANNQFGHDRTFQKVGPQFVATSAQRAIFGPGLGWQLENIASGRHWRINTPRSLEKLTRELTFNNEDSGFASGLAFRLNMTPLPTERYRLTTQMDWVRFEDGSLLIAAGDGDHSTKPPIRLVDAQGGGGVCRFYSPVVYRSNHHTRPSIGIVQVDGGQVWGEAWSDDTNENQITRKRPLDKVTSWLRLRENGEWETVMGGEDPPPPEPPGTQNQFLLNAQTRLDNGNLPGAIQALINYGRHHEGEI